MSLQQKSVRIVCALRLDHECTLLRQLVVTRIVAEARFSNECPTQPLHHFRRLLFRTGLFLELSDLTINQFITFLWNQSNGCCLDIGNCISNSVWNLNGRLKEPRSPEIGSNRDGYEDSAKQSEKFRFHWRKRNPVRVL